MHKYTLETDGFDRNSLISVLIFTFTLTYEIFDDKHFELKVIETI